MDVATLKRRYDASDSPRPRVAVDAMGGDYAPEEVVRGAVEWAREHPEADVILVGDEPRIRAYIDEPLPAQVTIVQAAESIAMEDQPAAAVRRKRDASINVCMRLVREGAADAVVTAGHTGAGVASAIVHLGRLPGVDRPALAVQMVTDRGPFVLLDIGATTDSTGLNLAQYAQMGTIYAREVLGVKDPSVALLSIGEEGGKGEQRVQAATGLIQDTGLRFLGNVEGRDLPRHPADVVVCDASVGNVTIKFFEGLSTAIFELLRGEFRRLPWGPLGYFFMRPGIARIRRRFDYERLGGAPLLGVRGTVLITHGRAKRRMIGFAVGVGAAAARARIPEQIAEALGPGTSPGQRTAASNGDASRSAGTAADGERAAAAGEPVDVTPATDASQAAGTAPAPATAQAAEAAVADA